MQGDENGPIFEEGPDQLGLMVSEMTPFSLVLSIAPAFHRPSSICIKGNTVGSALFEVKAVGLLSGDELMLPVAPEKLDALYDCCQRMFLAWREEWSRPVCDGISVAGTLNGPAVQARTFSLQSPPSGSVAHIMLVEALGCFPPELCGAGAAGRQLEIVRSHFDMQPPVTIFNEFPRRVRLAPWVHPKDAEEVARRISALPEGDALIIDGSGVENCGKALAGILPLSALVRRKANVRWRVRSAEADVLTEAGVDPSLIELVPLPSLSCMGYPIVLGDVEIGSPQVLALAEAGERIELIRALRREYALSVEQAARAAGELAELLARQHC